MSRLIAEPFVSLDGVVEMSHNWTTPYFDQELAALMKASSAEKSAMLMGRNTYQEMVRYWPEISSEGDPVAGYMNRTPKYVVSDTLESLTWENSTLISGNVLQQLELLKDRPESDISIPGSAALVRSLLHAGLLDELRPLVFPVVLGSGARLFDGWDEPLAMTLTSSASLRSGVLALAYQPAGTTTEQ